jgi:hypothetical protein
MHVATLRSTSAGSSASDRSKGSVAVSSIGRWLQLRLKSAGTISYRLQEQWYTAIIVKQLKTEGVLLLLNNTSEALWLTSDVSDEHHAGEKVGRLQLAVEVGSTAFPGMPVIHS